MNVDMPRQYADDSCIMRVVWTSYDLISALTESPDMVIGGVYEPCIYRFPEFPKQVKEWKLTGFKSVENTLVARAYPPSDLLAGANVSITPLRMSY